jgi:hypothetical protein
MSVLEAAPPEPLAPWTPADEERRLAAIRQLAAALTVADGQPSDPTELGSLRSLPRLQRLLDAVAAGTHQADLAETHAELVSAGFGHLLASELGLDWCVLANSPDREPVLRYRQTEVLLYPRRLLRRQLELPGRVDLGMLFRNTRDYLVNLQRFLFTDRRSRRAQNLTGKGKAAEG